MQKRTHFFLPGIKPQLLGHPSRGMVIIPTKLSLLTHKCIQASGGIPAGKRQLRKTCRNWEDDIKADLRETGLEYIECFHLVFCTDQ
jgi:hypothetical protein